MKQADPAYAEGKSTAEDAKVERNVEDNAGGVRVVRRVRPTVDCKAGFGHQSNLSQWLTASFLRTQGEYKAH